MKLNIFKLLIASTILLLSTQVQALLITPSTTSLVPGAGCGGDLVCEAATSSTSSSVIDAYIEDMYGVTELYKADQVNGASPAEAGSFAGDYDTAFLATPDDPSGAMITFTGPDSIDCPDCYLLVKDGNHNPAWYLFDIGSWDGMETIELADFWPYGGAISHVSIFGDAPSVPEPGVLALLGLGLVVMVASRKKVK